MPGDAENTQGDIAEAKKNGFSQYDFLSEGDSPSFFYLVNTGLRSLENPAYGGWGGRFASSTHSSLWEDGKNVTDYNDYDKKEDISFAQTRWIDALQNDFAARADWCVKNYNEANHAPVVKLNQAENISGKPGDLVKLNGSATDPDGNELTYHWWQYEEAGTYAGKIEIANSQSKNASFLVPPDAKSGNTIHVILEVKDSGSPPLTRYQRVIVAVR